MILFIVSLRKAFRMAYISLRAAVAKIQIHLCGLIYLIRLHSKIQLRHH